MPTLVVQIGLRSTTLTYFSSLDKTKTIYLNFAYSPHINRTSFEEGEYYEALVKQICSQNKISLEKTEVVLVCTDHHITSKYKCLGLDEIMAINSDTDMLYIDGNLVSINGQIHNSADVHFLNFFSNKNEKLNKDLYSITFSNEDLLNEIHDNYLKKVLFTKELTLSPLNLYKNVVLTGPRFFRRPNLSPADIRLILDVCNWDEVITLQMDSDNSLAANLVLKTKDVSAFEQKSETNPYRSLGSLINTNGEAEVLVSSDEGTNQLFDLAVNELFLVPLDASERVRVKVKPKGQLMKEYVLSGGSYGLIFDSRLKRDTQYLEQDRNDAFWLGQRLELSESLNRI